MGQPIARDACRIMSDVKQTEQKRIGTGKPGPGRPKGSPNKSTTSVKAAFEEAFDKLGGVDALLTWAKDEPREFYKLYAKLLPVQVQADMKHSGTVNIMVETGVPRAPDDPVGAANE